VRKVATLEKRMNRLEGRPDGETPAEGEEEVDE
jgi:hypothetical protein